MSKPESMTVRDYNHDDRNFILATWLRGLYYGDTWFSQIPKAIFMLHYHKIIENILSTEGIKVRVACLSDAPGVILGYSISRNRSVDWVFVKSAWRKIGIAKKLLPVDTTSCSHLTKIGAAIIKSKASHIQFNPFV